MSNQRRYPRPERFAVPDATTVRNAVAADHITGPVQRMLRDLNRKWGDDRLPELVSVATAARYGRQLERYQAAYDASPVDLATLQTEAERMCRALTALDAEAEAASAPKANPEVWELRVDGRRAAIVRDAANACQWAKDHPDVRVYSLDEVARILAHDGLRIVEAAKAAFPGATITAIRPKSGKTELGEFLDDQIPF